MTTLQLTWPEPEPRKSSAHAASPNPELDQVIALGRTMDAIFSHFDFYSPLYDSEEQQENSAEERRAKYRGKT